MIDLIATKNVVDNTPNNTEPIKAITPESIAPTDSSLVSSPKDPLGPSFKAEVPSFQYYDPIDAGILDEQHAYCLVKRFQTSFIFAFPFVVVDVDGPTLRKDEPFLFHAILAVTAYDTPKIQYLLGEELRRQVARTIEFSHKGLGILQGLLVYGAWYHTFYLPRNQQVAIIVQLCVALIQDLGISKNIKAKPGKWSVSDCGLHGRAKGTISEKRAYLGTFFLSVT